jgi:hypothetical protein
MAVKQRDARGVRRARRGVRLSGCRNFELELVAAS